MHRIETILVIPYLEKVLGEIVEQFPKRESLRSYISELNKAKDKEDYKAVVVDEIKQSLFEKADLLLSRDVTFFDQNSPWLNRLEITNCLIETEEDQRNDVMDCITDRVIGVYLVCDLVLSLPPFVIEYFGLPPKALMDEKFLVDSIDRVLKLDPTDITERVKLFFDHECSPKTDVMECIKDESERNKVSTILEVIHAFMRIPHKDQIMTDVLGVDITDSSLAASLANKVKGFVGENLSKIENGDILSLVDNDMIAKVGQFTMSELGEKASN